MTDKYPATQIYKIFDYEPYRSFGEDNPKRNDITFKMMDLKNSNHHNHQSGIDFFKPRVHSAFQAIASLLKTTKIQLAIVPSSAKGLTAVGLEALVKDVKEVSVKYNPLFLHRDYDVTSAKNGGERSIKKHLDSISIKVEPDVNIPVLILDDVTTTGSSLEACREIILNSGVKTVYMLAIGKTV